MGAALSSMRWGGILTVQLTSLAHKYVMFSGVPVGLLYYVFGLFVICRGLTNTIRPQDFALLAVAIAGGGVSGLSACLWPGRSLRPLPAAQLGSKDR